MVPNEQRLLIVEEKVSRLEGASVHLATKADVEKLRSQLIMWFVGQGIAVVALIFLIMRFALDD